MKTVLPLITFVLGAALAWFLKPVENYSFAFDDTPIAKDSSSLSVISGDEARVLIKNYENTYARTLGKAYPKESITNSVWFPTAFIHHMDTTLQNAKATHDGVRIFLGAYKSKVVPSQGSNNQISMFFVGTKPGLAEHHINDTAFFPPVNGIGLRGILNHGQLCPQICDTLPLP